MVYDDTARDRQAMIEKVEMKLHPVLQVSVMRSKELELAWIAVEQTLLPETKCMQSETLTNSKRPPVSHLEALVSLLDALRLDVVVPCKVVHSLKPR